MGMNAMYYVWESVQGTRIREIWDGVYRRSKP